MNSTGTVPRGTANKYLGIAMSALLIFGAVAAVFAYYPQNALAQTTPTITTSTNTFFGNNIVQVIVTDNTKNSASGTPETTAVTVTVKDNTGATKGTATVSAREIGTNSGQFEFFVTRGTHDPSAPRSESTAANAAVVRFDATAPTTNANDPTAIATTSTPGDGWKVEIEYPSTAIKTVNYQPTSAAFNVDRTVVGQGTNTVFQIVDQDANNDPTVADTITPGTPTTTGIPLGTATLISGTFGTLTVAQATLTETGQNTGVFEVTFSTSQLGVSSFASASTQSYDTRDYDVYKQPSGGGAAVASTSTTNTKTLVFRNDDGVLTALPQITFATEIPITVTDSDRNANTASKDSITATTSVGVTVTVDTTGGDSELVNIKETGDNTGIFAADLSGGKLPVTFLNTGSGTANNGVLELRPADVQGNVDIEIAYRDAAKSDGTADTASTKTSTVRLALSHTAGQLSFDAGTVTATGKAKITLNDPDLNNNPDALDSYTVTISTTAATSYDFTNFGNIASIAPKIKGVSTGTTAAASSQTIVFIETGANTGIFSAEVDMQKLSTSFSDGDQVELKYKDKLESPTADSTATITIGKPSTGVAVDRTTVAIPLTATEPSAVVGGTPTADSIKFRLTITDASKNTDSGVQQTIAATAVDDGTTANDIKLTTSGGTALTIGTAGTNDIVYSGFPLTETGPDTGVFSALITLTSGTGSGRTLANLDNAKLTITYDSNTATVTLRPSDLVITTDKTIVKNGDNVVVTITDLDRNKDSETVDEVPFQIATQNDAITGTGGTFTTTAKETGVNTGVFTKTVKVGTDIKLTSVGTSVTQATELKITATDRVATDRTSPDRDLTIKVGTTSGTISVTPEEVGPGTKLSILVNDNDLNSNPAGVDTIPTTGVNTDYVTVITDRSNFPSTKVQGEETGANTGVFKTTIKLKPKTTAATVSPATPTGTKDLTNFEVLPGDLVSIKYVDTKNVAGSKVTVSKIVKVVSQDPEMNVTSTTVAPGNSINLTVTDLDANTDGEAVDSITVRVTSSSDPVGLDVKGLETGPNTGIFTVSVPTTTSVSSGSITVQDGGSVTFKYTDTYPADYADRVKNVADPSKDFLFSVNIGAVAAGDVTATSPTEPVTKDISGNIITEVTAGSQVILSTDITNNKATSTPFAAIVEVRDADGFTVYLQWQTGTLNASGTTGVGLSWTPDAPGTYTVRTFVLSNIANPLVLSPVAESTITVS